VPGGGGNSAVFVAADGVVIVDAKSPSRGEDLLAQIRRVTDKPVRYVINTHSHDDHTGGDDVMPASAEIVVQEHTAANMRKMRRNGSMPAGRCARSAIA
jgi:glyoxylase-like metal-dependent hydrolase (beta-lactamase superfamily II)